MAVKRTKYLKLFADRRKEIVALARKKGNAEAARIFGVSRERVRQLRGLEEGHQAVRSRKRAAAPKKSGGAAR